MINNETGAAEMRLNQANVLSDNMIAFATQAVRKVMRDGSTNVMADATELAADAMEELVQKERLKDDDLYSDLLAIAIDRVDWRHIARSFVKDASEAEAPGYSDPPAQLEPSSSPSTLSALAHAEASP